MSISVESTARDQADAVRRREISARELLDLHLDRIGERNPELNAIVSLDEERAREGAAAADEALASGAEVGALHGLPFAFKDTHGVAGWRTTYGSPLFADHVPEHDDLIVERVRRAGVVVIGKTNVPEFAAGSHTFNRVFGLTRNPVDPSRSAGGSSRRRRVCAGVRDGAARRRLRHGRLAAQPGVVLRRRRAAALARPGAEWPLYNQWETTSVGGPMARNVGDLALLLSVMAGPDPRAPQALGDPGAAFAPPLDRLARRAARGALARPRRRVRGRRRGRRGSSRRRRAVFAAAGASVTDAHPQLAEADDTFRTLRAWHFQAKFGLMLAAAPDEFKQSLADNIRAGESLTGADVARAYSQRTALSERMREFFATYDVLVLPVSQVPPFPADQEFPHVDQRPPDGDLPRLDARGVLHHRHRLPRHLGARSGTTADGLPVGIQIVAAARARPAPARGRRGVRGCRQPERLGRAAQLIHRAGGKPVGLATRALWRTAANLWSNRANFGGTRRMLRKPLARRFRRA